MSKEPEKKEEVGFSAKDFFKKIRKPLLTVIFILINVAVIAITAFPSLVILRRQPNLRM